MLEEPRGLRTLMVFVGLAKQHKGWMLTEGRMNMYALLAEVILPKETENLGRDALAPLSGGNNIFGCVAFRDVPFSRKGIYLTMTKTTTLYPPNKDYNTKEPPLKPFEKDFETIKRLGKNHSRNH